MTIPTPSTVVARICTAFALSFLFQVAAVAQTVNTGAIEGRVLDEARGEYLQNARVTVEGTQLETFTDAGGYFILGNVPAGAGKLRVFFTGLPLASVPVSITAGQTTTKEVSLSTRTDKTALGEPIRL